MVKGKVTKLTNFGVFVELEPGLEGLLHISELADHKVESPEEVVKVGDEIEVKILRVDRGERKIGLSRKKAQWTKPGEEEGEAEGGRGRPTAASPRSPRSSRADSAAAARCSASAAASRRNPPSRPGPAGDGRRVWCPRSGSNRPPPRDLLEAAVFFAASQTYSAANQTTLETR